MRSRKAALALSSLVVLQVLGATGFVTANVSAQADALVAVIIGEVSRDACEVTYRESDEENWGGQSLDGPPVACQGGLVTAYILTQEEANSRVARSATRSESQEVTVVPLTGDPSADEEAITAEMIAIHEILDPGIVPEEGSNQNVARAAGDCRQGHKGQKRRADIKFKSYNVGAVVQAYVHYKRVNCARWKITDVKMTLTEPPSRDRIWFRDFMYEKVWVPTTLKL